MSEQHCRRVVNMEKVSGEFKQTYLYPPRCCRKIVKRQGCFDDREISIPTLCCIWICSCIFLSEGPRHFPNMSPILMRTNRWKVNFDPGSADGWISEYPLCGQRRAFCVCFLSKALLLPQHCIEFGVWSKRRRLIISVRMIYCTIPTKCSVTRHSRQKARF